MAVTAEGVRICRGTCGYEKPIEDFGWYSSHGIRKRRWKCRDCMRPSIREAIRASNARLRLEVIQAYGGHCACCGNGFLPHLTIDHIEGGGTQDRQTRTDSFYVWLRREGFPSGYQVLCFNCNFTKWSQGECLCSVREVI